MTVVDLPTFNRQREIKRTEQYNPRCTVVAKEARHVCVPLKELAVGCLEDQQRDENGEQEPERNEILNQIGGAEELHLWECTL